MKKITKLLFVCNANLNRSITFEHYFKKNKYKNMYEVKSCGTLYGYPNKLNKKLIDWADVIYVMDMMQYKFIHDNYQEAITLRKVKIVGISDQYNPDDYMLIELIEFWERFLMEE